MEPIVLNSYNLADAEANVIRRCFEDHPNATNGMRAIMLGVSERTLYRIAKKYGYDRNYTGILKAKDLLENNGYTVTQKAN